MCNPEETGNEASVSSHKLDIDNKAASSRRLVVDNSVAQPIEHITTKALFQYATWFDYFLMFWGAIGACIVGFGQPAMVVVLTDMINSGGANLPSKSEKRDEFDKAAARFAVLALVTFFGGWVYSACFKLTGYRQGCLWRKAYLEAILCQEVGWFDINNPNELPTFISASTANVEDGISSKLGDGIRFMSQGLSGSVLAFWHKWDLALVMTALSPIAMFGIWLLGHIISKTAITLESAYANAGAIVSEAFGSIRTVAALQGENKAIQGYNRLLDVAEKAGIACGWQNGFGAGMLFASADTMFGLGILYAAYSLAEEIEDSEVEVEGGFINCAMTETCDTEGGDLLAALFCLQVGAQGLGLLEPTVTAFVKARTSAHTIQKTIQRVPVISRSAGGTKLDKVEGKLEFSDVKFSYPSRPGHRVLRGFNLTVGAGTTVALVGTSGCGKSTSIQLLERFYDPQSGTVCLDGVDIKSLGVGWLRSQIGLVSQEPVLFSGSISENIAYGMPGATQAEVEAAAVMANAHDFITGFDEGYFTDVGTGGGQLSGGQKQRIAIARAIIKDPAVLLLDEATSALDNESERVVQAALDDLMKKKKRTTVVVAHRLTTIRNADKIVVVDRGVVVEEGTHESLMEKGEGGYYHSLVTAAACADDAEQQTEGETEGQIMEEGECGGGAECMVGGVRLGEQVKVGCGDNGGTVQVEAGKKEKRQKKEKKELVKRVWRMHDRADRKHFLIGSIGGVITGAVNPIVGYVITRIILLLYLTSPGEMRYEGRVWAVVMICLSLVLIASETMRGYGFAVTGEKLTRKLRELAFASTLHQEIGWFDLPENGADVVAVHLATDVTEVQALSGDALGRNVLFVSAVLTGLLVGFALGSYIMTLVAMVVLPVMGFGIALEVAVFTGGSGSKVESIGGSASAIVSQAVSSVRTVASFNLEDTLNHNFSLCMDAHLKKSRPESVRKGFITGISQLCIIGALSLLYWIGGILVTEDVISFADMMTSVWAVFMMASGFGVASIGARDTGKAVEAAKRLFSVLDRTSLIDPLSPGDGTTIEALRGDLRFHNVHFSYPTRQEEPVLRGFNLTVEAGTTVALVGTSGCGKSTSIQLLERFYDPQSGAVCLDGVDIKSLGVGWLRSQIGLVSQEPVLFSGSILENIAYGMPGATQAEVEAAAVMANAHDFITGFDKGYDTHVGTGGGQLSGGQKQRIAIARAIIKDPAVLLLDEATSALDNESERVVQAALDDLMKKKKRTTVVVAHRLTTIRNADKIVVVDGGMVVEEGTHESLMEKEGWEILCAC